MIPFAAIAAFFVSFEIPAKIGFFFGSTSIQTAMTYLYPAHPCYWPNLLAGIVFLATLPLASLRAENHDWQSAIELAIHTHHYLYREYDELGGKLNQEKGRLPGLSLAWQLSDAQWQWLVGGQVMAHQVDYQGQTNLGNWFVSLTDERMHSFYSAVYRTVSPALKVGAAVKWFEWDRQIRPRGSILGLNEVYNWQQLELGMTYQLYAQGTWQCWFEGRVTRTIKPTVKVDLTRNRLGIVKLTMSGARGYAARLATRYRVAPKLHLTARVEYQTWSFAASALTEAAGRTIPVRVQEPESESALTSLSIGVAYLF